MPVRSVRGRHAVQRAGTGPGPVTAALRVFAAREPRWAAFLLRAWPALAPLALIRAAVHNSPDLAGYAGQVLGFDATLCLIACLVVTPAMSVAKLPISRLRWWYGTWMFWLGAAGLGIALSMGGPGSMAFRAAGTGVNWTGMAIIVLLAPMAVTSNVFSQKKLGKEWKRWQRGLVWAVWLVVGAHLLLLRDWYTAYAFGMASVPLILLRTGRAKRAIKTWRAGGYSTGWLWVLLSVCVTIVAAGLVVLAAEEVLACVRAAALWPLP